MFVSIKGGPYANFRRALERGNLDVIRGAAAELPRVDLADALTIVLLMDSHDDRSFERAATRWLARLVLERPALRLAELRSAVSALESLPRDREASIQALRQICTAHRLEGVFGL
jgi:hypothetical protein